jgi:hypothetical protein
LHGLVGAALRYGQRSQTDIGFNEFRIEGQCLAIRGLRLLVLFLDAVHVSQGQVSLRQIRVQLDPFLNGGQGPARLLPPQKRHAFRDVRPGALWVDRDRAIGGRLRVRHRPDVQVDPGQIQVSVHESGSFDCALVLGKRRTSSSFAGRPPELVVRLGERRDGLESRS